MLPTKTNYLHGTNPRKWRIGVPNYAKVRYKSVYPGVDLLYYADRGQLEWDLIVGPGADAGNIKLEIEGADYLQLDAQGDLMLRAGADELRLRRPVAYEQTPRGRHQVISRYQIENQRVKIRLGGCDKSKPLVIDPGLEGNGGTGIAVDAAGNIYVSGYTNGPDYPATTTSLQPAMPDVYQQDCVVVKFDATGQAVYNTYFGGSDADVATAIAVDSGGNAYITGFTYSPDFPTVNAFQRRFGGPAGPAVYIAYPPTMPVSGGDAFIAKLNPAGSALIYSTFLGGAGQDYGNAIAVDSAGSAYVTGTTFSPDFPVTAGSFQPIRRGASDVFVTKVNSSGSQVVYSTYLGGTGQPRISGISYSGPEEEGNGIALDDSGDAYVTGHTLSADFPTYAAMQPVYGGQPINSQSFPKYGGAGDAFVTVLNAAGSAQLFSTFLGGSEADVGNGIAVASDRSVYVTGLTVSSDFPVTPGAFMTALGGSMPLPPMCAHLPPPSNAFVTKLNIVQSRLIYSSYLL
jgi:hypothetical protein